MTPYLTGLYWLTIRPEYEPTRPVRAHKKGITP